MLIYLSAICSLFWVHVHVAYAEPLNELSCDNLVPEYCMLPFPNDYWRIKSKSGYQLQFQNDTFPADDNGGYINPTAWNKAHGFSVFPAITTYFEGMQDSCISNMARWWNIELSLEKDSPIIILDTVTKEAVPYWY